jgi:hypothetical protein
MKTLGLALALAAATPVSMLVGANVAAAADAVAADVSAVSATAAPVVGKMLYSADGKKLAAIYKIDANGAPQVLIDGRMFTIPVASLSETDGKTTTSLTKKDLFTRS